MEEIIHEIAAHPELRECCLGIAHRSKEPSLEAVECLPLIQLQIVSPKKPPFRLDGGLLAMTIASECKGTVRNKVRKDNFARVRGRCVRSGHGTCRLDGHSERQCKRVWVRKEWREKGWYDNDFESLALYPGKFHPGLRREGSAKIVI